MPSFPDQKTQPARLWDPRGGKYRTIDDQVYGLFGAQRPPLGERHALEGIGLKSGEITTDRFVRRPTLDGKFKLTAVSLQPTWVWRRSELQRKRLLAYIA